MIAARTKAALGVKKAKGEKMGGSIPFGFSLAADGIHLNRTQWSTRCWSGSWSCGEQVWAVAG